MHDLLRRIREGVLVFDGAMGTSLQQLDLSKDDFGGLEGCNENLVFSRPEAVERVHEGFLKAGCDVIETDTFGGTPRKLGEYGLADRCREQNAAAARLARRVADRFSTHERPRFVSGSIGPTGLLPASEDPDLGGMPVLELSREFEVQALGLLEGGVDGLQVETVQDILEAKAAVLGIRRAFAAVGRRVPLIVQVTLDATGRMLLGTDVHAALTTVESLGADLVGLNCSTGPEEMRDAVRALCDRASLPVTVLPNAGIPLNVGGVATYPMTPGPFAKALREFVEDFGVDAVGGCCGTTPEHLAAVVEALRGVRRRERPRRRAGALSSMMAAADLTQDPRPTLVGERVNSQGSRRMKRLLLADDVASIVDVAREQVEGGAHVLDVCVALTERADEREQMVAVLRRLALSVPAPVCVDSTEPAVIRAALEVYPGRALVNSINMENGRARIDAVMPAVREYGAAVVALTIDETGMAKTADQKVEVARRIHGIVTGEFGLAPGDLVFDALTFTLATGDAEFTRSAVETLEGIRRIREALPGVRTILGVSNVSFGLGPAARKVLNSAMLFHAVRAGLDMAIVNPSEITPYPDLSEEERTLADDLLLARREDSLPRFLARFEGRKGRGGAKAVAADAGPAEPAARVHWCILHRRPDGIEALLDACLESRTPVEVLNGVLLPAMKEVGDRFGSGELILPFVLQSAEVMKRAVSHVEKFLDRAEGVTKGRVVLATVYGDVHDIGKNLVRTILGNNGYTVFDLGKQVPAHVIVEKAVEVKADLVGLSALLVSTSKQMPVVVQELRRRGVEVPVLIGGAAINRPFGKRANRMEDGSLYGPGVFYCRDAFEGLATADGLRDDGKRAALVATVHAPDPVAPESARAAAVDPDSVARSSVRDDVPPPKAPFWGPRDAGAVDLREVFPLISERDLYFLQWGVRPKDPAERERLIDEEFRPLRERLERECVAEGLLVPRAVLGYWPCRADGRAIEILDPADRGRVLHRLEFPRQAGGKRLCLADYVASKGRGVDDVIALQCVTVGARISAVTERLSRDGDYAKSYHLHGLAVAAAEALAEWTHRRVLREMGLPPNRGKRFSPGYPACPDLAQHGPMFELLGARKAIGVDLTAAFQIDPEASTAAFVLHHPDTEYFHTKGVPTN